MPPQHDTGKPKETADVVEGVVAEGYGTATEEEVPRFWLYLSRVSRNVTEAQIAKLAVDRLGVVDVKVKRLVAKGKDVSRMRFISFKVGVHVDLKHKALASATWPDGLVFREFEERNAEIFWEPSSAVVNNQENPPPPPSQPLTTPTTPSLPPESAPQSTPKKPEHVLENSEDTELTGATVPSQLANDVQPQRPGSVDRRDSSLLTIYYQNVRGLRTKTNQLHLSLSSCDYDVIAFSETWLNAKIVDSELSSDYTFYRADRSRETSVLERGGGVLIGVKKRFHPEPIHLRGGEKLEQIAVRIPLPGKTLFVCCVYIPPNSDATIYTQHSSCVQQLCDLAQGPDEVIVVGDYNVPNLTWHFDEDINGYLPSGQSTEQEVALIEDVLGTGLQQMFDLPNANGRLLDLALVSDSSRFQLIEPPRAILKVDAHHMPFILVLDTQSTGTAAEQSGTYYDFANCDTTELNNSIASLDWANLLLVGSVDDIVERFYDKLNAIIREVVPLKHRRPHPNSHQPWWNRETRNLRNRLRKARKRFLKHPTEMLGRELADRELHYEMSLEAAFRGYISGIESNLKREPKSFWAFVKKRKQDKGIPQDMVYRDSSATTPDDSVQLFADFFKTVYSANQPTPSNESLDKILPHELHMPLVCLTEEDVRKVLASTDASKGPGPDCIPPSIVKQCAATLANPLAIIFNRSLESGVFPAKWKVASITPIHKSGNVHKLGGSKSELFMIPSGVPQGSHLGPLIFLLFIDDLCHWIKNDKVLYADDLKFYRTITSPLDCLALQSDIDSLMRWCDQNGMEANAKKCQVITFDPASSAGRSGFRAIANMTAHFMKLSGNSLPDTAIIVRLVGNPPSEFNSFRVVP
ncbi:hypothetical protein pipiens_013780 [Culex pipiens pipiens]|uniref:Reverse transcriptase domain-containing protein n=1 Tax=Culex pipiens pipiens TaxID=38569 RepID=A0ABD1CXD0_CULPP